MAKMVDRVKKAFKHQDQIRNIAIAAHIDHGKTTFSDNLLEGAGMMSQELAGEARELDFHDDEQERGITIDSASVSMVHEVEGDDHLINLIDTPGHVDFGGDVTRAMRAVDGCIVLVCAVEGVMPQTETVLRQALKERVKPILFINKVDRLIKELKLSPEEMQERFTDIIKEVNKLIKDIAEEEYGEKWTTAVKDGTVTFGSAFHNWALSIPYMQANGIGFDHVIDAYEDEDDWKTLRDDAPIHEVILNEVVKHHPNPKKAQQYRIPSIWKGDEDGKVGQDLANCDPDGQAAFVVTKVTVDPQAGEICAGRLFSGTVEKGMDIQHMGTDEEVRVQQVYVYNGAQRSIVPEAPAGNIIGVAGLGNAFPGDTFSDVDMTPFEAITHIFDPVVTVAIEAKNPADLPKLIEVLMQVSKEDPSVEVEIDQDTGEHLLHGMGELHLEVIENRIKDEKGVEIETSPPIVVFRESIQSESEDTVMGKSPNKHNKVFFRVEPLSEEFQRKFQEEKLPEGRLKKGDRDEQDILKDELGMDAKAARNVRDIYKGNMLVDETRGIVHINEIMEMVQDMFEDVMDNGPLAQEPGIGVKVVLDDVKLHEDAIHRGPAQMYPAIRDSIRGAMSIADPILFEPVQTLMFEAPAQYTGDISKLIANKRGQLINMQQEGKRVEVKGKMPVAEMFGMASELRSATGGRGSSYLIDQEFEPLPHNLQDKIINQIRDRKGIKQDDEDE
jgi:elongation factor 2